MRLVVIPTASRRADDAHHEPFLAPWRQFAGESVTVLHTRDRQEANSPEFVAPLREATAVWFSGGVQSRIAAAYLDTLVEQELQHLLARGGVIGGTSAGAAIQSRTMIAGGNPVPRIARGFDLFPGTVIDQHFLARNRQPRLVHAVAGHPHLLGVGVDESTALIVQGRQMNVLGRSSVTFVLAAAGDFAEKTVTLKAGETADLVAWQQKVRKRREEVTADEEPHADGTRPPRR